MGLDKETGDYSLLYAGSLRKKPSPEKKVIPEVQSFGPREEMPPPPVVKLAKPVEPLGSQDDAIYIPSATLAWFDPETFENSICDFEQECLPEFFSGKYPSKTA